MPARTHDRILSIKLKVLNIGQHIWMRLDPRRLFRMQKFSPPVLNSYLIRPKHCGTFCLKYHTLFVMNLIEFMIGWKGIKFLQELVLPVRLDSV
jgi:hypothetical protein